MSRRSLTIGPAVCLALLVALVSAAPARAHYSLSDSVPCNGAVIIKPRTDFVAFDFRVRNMRCSVAKRVARRYATTDRSPFSFRCISRGRQDGDGRNLQAHTDVRCRSGRRITVFVIT